ncbi:nucleotide pyrophosphohydrolase [Sulfodiicoccus acidiphilus]|nr:nucleotide pyrophosphohydrolase [Sulfodiicoccus acidiphilus]
MYYEKDEVRGVFATFTWLVEEVGELAEALLEGDEAQVEEELADVVAWTFSIASLKGVDVEDALRRKYGL